MNVFPTLTVNKKTVPYIRSDLISHNILIPSMYAYSTPPTHTLNYNILILVVVSYLDVYLSFSDTMRNFDLGLPDSATFLQQRVFTANVLPLFAVLCAMLAWRAVKLIWSWSPLHYFTLLWKVGSFQLPMIFSSFF